MKRIISILLLSLTTIPVIIGQDIIVTRSSERIDCVVTEVSDTEVKYKRADNPDGPLFVISTSKISSIIYKNGEVQSFDNVAQQPAQTQQPQQVLTATPVYDFWGNPDYSSLLGNMNVDKIPFVPGQTFEYKFGKYVYGNVAMDGATYKAFIHRYCPAAYNEYVAAETLSDAGFALLGVGGGIILGDMIVSVVLLASKKDINMAAFGGIMGAGGAVLIAGIPLACIGPAREKKTINTYNGSCAKPAVSLRLNFNTDGVGLNF